MPVALPPGRLRLVTSPSFTGISDSKHDRDRVCRRLRGQRRRRGERGGDHSRLTLHEIGGERGEPLVALLGPAIFDRDVLPFDITALGEPLAQCEVPGPAASRNEESPPPADLIAARAPRAATRPSRRREA